MKNGKTERRKGKKKKTSEDVHPVKKKGKKKRKKKKKKETPSEDRTQEEREKKKVSWSKVAVKWVPHVCLITKMPLSYELWKLKTAKRCFQFP